MENKIGRYHRQVYKAHCADPALARKIASWDGCERSAIYHFPDGHREVDVLFPGKLYNRVAQLLGLPPRSKNLKRMAQGKRMSVINKKHRFSRNTRSENGLSEAVFREGNTGWMPKCNLGPESGLKKQTTACLLAPLSKVITPASIGLNLLRERQLWSTGSVMNLGITLMI